LTTFFVKKLCMCVYARIDLACQFILKIQKIKYPFIYFYDGNAAELQLNMRVPLQ